MNSPFQRLWHRRIYVCGIFLKQVVFLTVYHRGPLPFRELHSTDDNRYSVERPWGILSLFYNLFRLRVNSPFQRLWHRHTHVCGIFVKQVVFLTVYHRGPLPLREFHSTDETLVWRDPGGSWACLRPASNYEWNHLSRGCDTDIYVCSIFVKQVVFLTVYHCGPLPLRELHSTDETLVWRDPGGSWACLRPVQIMSEFTFPEAVTQTYICMWHLSEAGRFSYGVSPRTPPL